MELQTLSHYTFQQFFMILYLLFIFILAVPLFLRAVFFSTNKKGLLIISSMYVLFLLSMVFLETAASKEAGNLFIRLFRVLNLLLFLIGGIQSRQNRAYRFLFPLHLPVLLLSYTSHYFPLYISGLLPLLYSLINKPATFDMLLEKEPGAILAELDEAVLILSIQGHVLFMNQPMERIIGGSGEFGARDRETALFLNENGFAINRLLNGEESPEKTVKKGSNYYLLNHSIIPGKGIIVTASDITDAKNLQLELEKSMTELDRVSEKLENYSARSEFLAIKKEREMVFDHIQKIIRRGLKDLYADLMKIRERPPEKYDTLLKNSRQLLGKVRDIVTSWSRLTGGIS